MQAARISRWLVLPLVACVAALAACGFDPVHDNAVAALGGSEGPYPAEGQFHRRGQPCALCHSSKGPASSEFLLGGTVFLGTCDDPSNKATCNRAPAGNAHVRIRSATGATRCFVTNAAGNFFVRKEAWTDFEFPYLATVERDGNVRIMGSHAAREGSCAGCHKSSAGSDSPGQISLLTSNAAIPATAKAEWPLPATYKQEESCTP